jgi:hypothetical protein
MYSYFTQSHELTFEFRKVNSAKDTSSNVLKEYHDIPALSREVRRNEVLSFLLIGLFCKHT